MRQDWRLVLSCEHGGREIPPEYAGLFMGADGVLSTHRGYDIGGLVLAGELSERLNAPLEAARVTRLLVDLNRSPGSPTLFSEYSRHLPPQEKARVLARYYHPYRNRVEAMVREALSGGQGVIHLAVHSFTPELRGQVRNALIGLLYDPGRPLERRFCENWQRRLEALSTDYRIRRNYPYRGASDALVTSLRRSFPPERYLGLELEVNQKLAQGGGPLRDKLPGILARSLEDPGGLLLNRKRARQ